MNKTKRVISAIMAMCMLISLLPAQIALATEDDIDDYIHYAQDDNIPADYKGHVWRLEEAPDGETNYDYTLKISTYNMQASYMYNTSLKFDDTVVNLVDSSGKAFTGSRISNFMDIAKPTSAMTKDSYALDSSLSATGSIFNDIATVNNIDKDGDYYKIAQYFGVQASNAADSDFDPTLWNTDEGAQYGTEIDGYTSWSDAYKFPPNIECDLFTLKFKRVADSSFSDGKKPIDSNTIRPIYDKYERGHGGVGWINDPETKQSTALNEGVLLIGFPEPANNQTVTFNGVQDAQGNDLNAEINIYSDSNRTEFVTKATKNEAAAASSTNPVTYSATVDAGATGRTYYYSINVSGYNETTGNFTVQQDAGAEVPVAQMSLKTADEYDVEVIVKDADTGDALEGATVSYLGKTATTTTDAQGTRAVIKMTAGQQSAKASMAGYTESEEKTFTVSNDNTTKVEISLVPERASVTLPRTSAGIAESKATVKKLTTDNQTAEWGTDKTYTGSALSSAVAIPKGNVYEVTYTAPKYLSKTLYLKVEADGTYKFYTENPIDVTTPAEFTDSVVELQKLDDPYYYVEVKADSADPTTYTAKVTLNNVEAENGTFGLQYDNKVFSLETFNIADGIKNENVMLPDVPGAMLTRSDDTTAVTGYHAFSWIVDGVDADGSQAQTSLNQDIATYTFKLKDGKSAKDVTSAAFTVMPFDKTKAGLDFIKAGNDLQDSREYLDALWRYIDDKNDAPSPRRLSKDKATLNGFHQVYVPTFDGNYPDDAPENSVMTDVRTQFDFTPERAALQFVVTDEDNIALDDAVVKIYDKDTGELEAEIQTDETGIVTYPVDGDKEYQYVVSLPGYWDVPEEGLKDTSVEDKKTTVEFVTMEKKIYHTPKLECDPSVTDGAHAVLAGDEAAYNGREFFFDIRPELGWKIENPVFEVSIKDDNGVVQTYELNNGVTQKDGMYALDANNVAGLPIDPPEIDPVHGYKSEDITIKLKSATITQTNEEFTVTATAGEHGTVTYTADTGAGEFAPPTGATTPGEKITLTPILPSANKTGTFTFTAAQNYKVEKAIINGVVFDYKNTDIDTLTYSFGEVTMNSDIIVTFWDGNEETQDAVVTLVVGPNGTASVTKPTSGAEADITNTRRTYLFKASELETINTLEFSAQSNASKVLVEKSVNGAAKEAVRPESGGANYSVPVSAKDNIVVYVSFDDSTVFVTSYIKEGLGMVDPAGVIIKRLHDSITVDMTAESNDPTGKQWSASSVDVDGTEIKNTTSDDSKFSYTVSNITADMSIGAIFTEATYSVTGYVDLSQNSNLTTAPAQTFAFVTCTRQEDGKSVTVSTTTDRQNAYFTVDLPKGTWDISVKKSGYINYTITGYTIEGTDRNVIFGKPTSDGDVKKITPFIGNTNGSGRTVSFADVGVVGNGLRKGVTGTILQRADVDDDGAVKADSDMMYIKANYGQRSITESYDDFMNRTVTPITP